jgi:hypothetical protein
MSTDEAKSQLAPARPKDGWLTLFHVTTRPNAKHIAARGFADNSARHFEGTEYNGVWLASAPPQAPVGNRRVLVKVELDLAPNELNHLEWRVLAGAIHEWLIPADYVNAHVVSLTINQAQDGTT